MLGMHGTRAANILLEECDLLLVAGARLDDRATGRLERFCSEAKLIHIDIDQSELDKLKLAHLANNTQSSPPPICPAGRQIRLAGIILLSVLKEPAIYAKIILSGGKNHEQLFRHTI